MQQDKSDQNKKLHMGKYGTDTEAARMDERLALKELLQLAESDVEFRRTVSTKELRKISGNSR
ncbi:hypothetical protein OWA38_003010 [Vibrio cholerae]|nr:hypothetical protein [Vibrio cholerae]